VDPVSQYSFKVPATVNVTTQHLPTNVYLWSY